ncbi:MAG: restriction endonuclease subunit S [Hyphomicrobium sp.]|nr:restriction endonuclease subunit S [Hyphomicrobium sp.]
MKATLGQLAKVRPGVAFRDAIRHIEAGQIAIVQAGDVQADGSIDPTALLRLDELPVRGEMPVIIEGEVLLQCRGQTYRAAVVPTHDMPMVPTASVLVLTPNSSVLPAYLSFILNDPATQAELRKRATGATIANLKRSVVEQLEVPLLTLDDQQKIVALSDVLRQQTRLEARLSELRRIELRAVLEGCSERNQGR